MPRRNPCVMRPHPHAAGPRAIVSVSTSPKSRLFTSPDFYPASLARAPSSSAVSLSARALSISRPIDARNTSPPDDLRLNADKRPNDYQYRAARSRPKRRRSRSTESRFPVLSVPPARAPPPHPPWSRRADSLDAIVIFRSRLNEN